MTDYVPRDRAYDIINGFPFNYQECRLLSTLGVPSKTEFQQNGCICSNYLVSAKEYVDDNGRKFVSCTNIDSGSIFFFILQCFISLLFFFTSIRSMFICIYLLPSLIDSIVCRSHRGYRQRSASWKTSIGLVKKHSLFCLFFLSLSAGLIGFFKVSETASYIYGIPDAMSPPDKQYHFSDHIPLKLSYAGHSFFLIVGLHFTILWMSAAPEIFSDIKMNEASWFNPFWYRRLILISEFAALLAIIFLYSDPSLIGVIQVTIGLVLIFEFSLGFQLISKRLRYISSLTCNLPKDSKQDIDVSSKCAKLINLADRLDFHIRKIRMCGAITLVFYWTRIITFDILRLHVSQSTIENQRAYIKEGASASFALLMLLAYNFLHERLFRNKEPEKKIKSTNIVIQKPIQEEDSSPNQVKQIKIIVCEKNMSENT